MLDNVFFINILMNRVWNIINKNKGFEGHTLVDKWANAVLKKSLKLWLEKFRQAFRVVNKDALSMCKLPWLWVKHVFRWFCCRVLLRCKMCIREMLFWMNVCPIYQAVCPLNVRKYK